MPGPNANPTGCCEMDVGGCCPGGRAPDNCTAAVTGMCGTFTGILYGQGGGANANCWTGQVQAQLQTGFMPPVCTAKTLNLTMCCDVHGNMVLTVDCGGAGSGSAIFPTPACSPLDITFSGVSLPVDCGSMEPSLQSVRVQAPVSG